MAKNKKKYLITGGLGFIGHIVVKQLQKQKHDVQVIDALTTYGYYDKNELEELYNQRLKKISSNTQIYKEDICVPEIDQVIENFRPDVVIHLADFPNAELVKKNPVEASRTMCNGLANILDCCARHSIPKVVYASSGLEYGTTEKANEFEKMNVSGQYSIWKIAGEELVKEFARSSQQSYSIVRLGTVYGPLDISNHFIGTWFKRAIANDTIYVENANDKLDFTFGEDAAAGIILATDTDNTTFNISKGTGIKLIDVAHKIKALVKKGKVKEKGKQETNLSAELDISAAQKDLKYKPKIDIDRGLKEYYNWFKKAKK